MKKLLFMMSAAVVMALGAASPVYFWDFDNGMPEGSGLKKKKIHKVEIAANEGFDHTAGAVCGPEHRNYIAYFSGLNWKAFTLELKFKPNRELRETKGGTLFSYAVNSYYRRQFTLSLEDDGKISAWFEIRDDKDAKKVITRKKLTGDPVPFQPGQWHTVRVAAESGKEMKIWLDGKLYAAAGEALSFSDLEGFTPREYPFAGIGYNVCNAGAVHAPFHGVIDDLAIWDSFVEPPLLAGGAAGEISRKDPNIAITSADRLEWSAPFTVYDRETATLGSFERAEEKFHDAAARAALQTDGENLHVRVQCPIPPGAKPDLEQNTPWHGDCVEFFLKPAGEGNHYYQFVVNANGKSAATRYLGPGNPDHQWQSSAAVKAEISPQQYSVHLAIPLRELGLDGGSLASGTVLTGNFTRNGPTAGGQSSWSAVGRNYHNPERFGKFIAGSRGAYFQKRLAELKKSMQEFQASELKTASLEKIAELDKAVLAQGDDPLLWDRLGDALYNAEQLLLQMSLDGKPYLIWEAPVWGNDLTVGSLARPLRKISLKAAGNSKAVYGFCFSNLTGRPFMGQLKFTANAEKLDRFNALPANTLYRRLTLKEGIAVREQNGLPIFDPLAPLPLNTLLRVNAGSSVPLWLEVNTGNLPPDVYKGYFYLKPATRDFPPEKIEFELEVVDIDLQAVQVDSFNYSYLPPEMYRSLVDYEFNMLYAGTPGQSSLNIYPAVDAEGNVLRHDFSDLDRKIEAYRNAGMPLEKMKIIFFLGANFNWITKTKESAPLKIWTPPWRKAFQGFLTGLNEHLQSRYGLGNERLIFYPVDEPHGDALQEGTTMNTAYRMGRLIKEVNPRFRTMVNPQLKEDSQTGKNLVALAETFDIITLYRGRTTPRIVQWAADTGREIWTYHILQKTNPPEIYRKLSWMNLRDRISGVSACWHLDQMAGGDGFDSADTFPGKKNSADYGTLYADFNYETLLSSRRQEAWYQGFLDYKLGTYCRLLIAKQREQGRDTAAQEKELDQIIDTGVNGDMKIMEQMRGKLLELALRLKTAR